MRNGIGNCSKLAALGIECVVNNILFFCFLHSFIFSLINDMWKCWRTFTGPHSTIYLRANIRTCILINNIVPIHKGIDFFQVSDYILSAYKSKFADRYTNTSVTGGYVWSIKCWLFFYFIEILIFQDYWGGYVFAIVTLRNILPPRYTKEA